MMGGFFSALLFDALAFIVKVSIQKVQHLRVVSIFRPCCSLITIRLSEPLMFVFGNELAETRRITCVMGFTLEISLVPGAVRSVGILRSEKLSFSISISPC